MTEITMPRLSDSMEQGTILTWLKADGEHVAKEEDLVEIETDKATMTYPSPTDGVLRIIAAEGTSLAVGEPIASLAGQAEPATNARSELEPANARSEPASADARSEPAPPLASAAAGAGPVRNGSGLARSAPAEPVRATPLARRLARIHEVDLTSLAGSGPHGRVTRRDVARAAGLTLPAPSGIWPGAAGAPAEPAPATQSAGSLAGPEGTAAIDLAADAQPPSHGGLSVRELTRLQQVVARRMAQAQVTVPDFQVETEVGMDAALALRESLKAAATPEEVVPSINDIIVKAVALALRRHPLANGSYVEDRFHMHAEVNIGIAVAADQALLVPTITEADDRSLGSIARQARLLSERVRDGKVTPAELSGATFTVSNLGMFGMSAITPVVNMPQAAILGVGAVRTVLARDEHGNVVDRALLTLRLSCDHRILYGADAARFLADVRELLQEPMRLAL